MLESIDVVGILERMAENGTAPREGCSLFGVGYEEAFDRIRNTYVRRRFPRGGSAEKFVVGPYGSGKTHFLRQLMEVGQGEGCVVSEVPLSRSVDFTKSLVVYREVVRELRPPAGGIGLKALLLAIRERLADKAPESAAADQLVSLWAAGLEEADLKLVEFSRIAKRAFDALLEQEEEVLDDCCRWLSGEFADRALCKRLEVSPMTQPETALFAKRALLSLLQLVRHAGFPGTVICYDEAEQGFDVDRRKMQTLLSLLQSDINAVSDLERGSTLIVYALTPDVIQRMEDFAALQQRVSDPGPGMGFFDGNTRAATIDLTARDVDMVAELQEMALGLVALLYKAHGDEIAVERDRVEARMRDLGQEVYNSDATSSSRRTIMKRASVILLAVLEEGQIVEVPRAPKDEDEV